MDPETVVWTRMQAEAGQPMEEIVARKERERVAGGGLFIWGVGNAPSLHLATVRPGIRLVFSKMIGKARAIDSHPAAVVRWRRWVDREGKVRDLPDGALVTSRATGRPRHHALMARSAEPLALGDHGPFDPTAWRNAGPDGRPPGASQVTALLVRERPDGPAPRYVATMVAEFGGWVALVDPEPWERRDAADRRGG